MLLKDKTAVITGCNRGIGRAVLEAFVKNGADVFAVVRRENPEFEAYCEKLSEETGRKIMPVYADFCHEETIKDAVKGIMQEKRPIDVLVNNIGMSNPLSQLAMTKMDTVREAFQVNLFSGLYLTQLISKNMMRNKKGSIVFISSSAAFDGGANVEYSASKAAVIGAVKRLAVELGNFGIRVNALAPGLTATDMGNSMSEEDEAIALSMNIMKRKGRPEEIADAAVFLGSDMSSFITAQTIRVDGGLR